MDSPSSQDLFRESFDVNDKHFRSIKALTSEDYDAESIKAEFKLYQSMLPKPDKLLQEQHSAEMLREMILHSNCPMPLFLKDASEGGIKPHHALSCLLLSSRMHKELEMKELPRDASEETGIAAQICSWLVWVLSFGSFPANHFPAEIIREQFNRVAHVIPVDKFVSPEVLRKRIRNHGLSIPNFFLDPENDKQFPPHIALLVVLQDGEKESDHLGSIIHRVAWSLLSFVALVLRLVLEVIGGAGAIWGGSECFHLRTPETTEQCRLASFAIGIFCLFRFVVLNAPQNEDEGDILGPAGPWSLRAPARLRAVFEHPFHYFVRARRPYSHAKDQRPLLYNSNMINTRSKPEISVLAL